MPRSKFKSSSQNINNTPPEDAFFGKAITYNGVIYTVNKLEDNRFSVWKEDDAIPYTTTFKPVSCTCTDWMIRKKRIKSTCKHHKIVNIFLNEEGENDLQESQHKPASKADPYGLNS